MRVRSLALVFSPLKFTSNLGGKTILEWKNNGKLSEELSRPTITRRMQRYYDHKLSILSALLYCFNPNPTRTK